MSVVLEEVLHSRELLTRSDVELLRLMAYLEVEDHAPVADGERELSQGGGAGPEEEVAVVGEVGLHEALDLHREERAGRSEEGGSEEGEARNGEGGRKSKGKDGWRGVGILKAGRWCM